MSCHILTSNANTGNQTLNESITIADRQVLAYSDMMLTAYDFTHLLSFNKAMIDELSLDDPYTLVDSGKWTLDRFNEYLAAATSDLNGDTIYDENDRYGFVSDAKQVSPCFWIAAGCLSIEKDDSDIPRFVMNSERMLNTLDRVYQLTWENDYWYKQLGVEEIGYTMFSNGQALFCNASFDALFGGISARAMSNTASYPIRSMTSRRRGTIPVSRVVSVCCTGHGQ